MAGDVKKRFDPRAAKTELARLRRRARKLEDQMAAHLAETLKALSLSIYDARSDSELLSEIRSFVNERD